MGDSSCLSNAMHPFIVSATIHSSNVVCFCVNKDYHTHFPYRYAGVNGLTLVGHVHGHRGRPLLISGHPILSLVLTVSANQQEEMLLWLPSTSPGPLASPSTSLRTIARLSVCPDYIAWFPCLITPLQECSFSSAPTAEVPITVFIAGGPRLELSLFLALIETPARLRSVSAGSRKVSDSSGSGLNGVILQLRTVFVARAVEKSDSVRLRRNK